MAGYLNTRSFAWNGSSIPFPTTTTWSFQDISSKNTGRALSGLMNKEVVATKRKLVCTWKHVSDSDAATILGSIKAQTYGTLTYPDAFSGTDLTKTFYTGDATATMIMVQENKFGSIVLGEEFIWDISLDFIER